MSKHDKRSLHGQLGEGRLRSLAPGQRVTWTSYSTAVTGELEQVTISGSRSERDRSTWNVRPAPAGARKTDTTFVAHNDRRLSLSALDSEDVVAKLRALFAQILLNDD
ncbi:hypothetical protein [Dermabacter hominis]|uniref:hypothetical protein n=1 Tax=Dermabacter hominis TaxID=36740 RepID=UPI003183E060